MSIQESARFAAATGVFIQRLQTDAAKLARFQQDRQLQPGSPPPDDLLSFVHKLAGAAGIFSFRDVSASASSLEDAIIAARDGRGAPAAIEERLTALVECIARELSSVGDAASADGARD